MRALVIGENAAGEERPRKLAAALARGLQARGVEAEVATLDPGTARSLAPYRLVCIGARARGLLGRRVADHVAPSLAALRGLAGKDVAAWVWAGPLAGDGALKGLMAALEAEGAFIRDFAVVRTEQDAQAFGGRLAGLVVE